MKQFNNNQILQDFQFLSILGLEISTWFFTRLTSKQIRNYFTRGTLRSLLTALKVFVTAQKIEKGFKILVERKKGSVVIYKSVVDRQSHGKKFAKTKCFVSNALFDNLKFAKKYVWIVKYYKKYLQFRYK